MRDSQDLRFAGGYLGSAQRSHSPSLIPLVGVAAYLIGSIFYVFPSGNPQPADLVLMITIIAATLGVWRRYPSEALLYFAAAIFFGYILLVNSFWYLQIGTTDFFFRTIFYLYNIIVCLFIIALSYHDYERLKTVVYWCLIASVAIQLVMLHVVPPQPGMARSTGTFNNPNQLGYWGLLVIACFGVVKDRQPLSLIDVGFLGGAAYALVRSLSKGASISGGLLIVMIIFFCGWRRGAGILLGSMVVVGATAEIAGGGYFGIVDRFTQSEAVVNLDRRLSSIGEQEDDNLMVRGYYRIFDNPELMIFGAGEGSFERLDKHGDPKEFHSTLGNLLTSYGVVGIGLLCFFLLVIFQRAPLASFAYFVPIMLYGVTHNGIRFSLLWFFLALVYAQSVYGNERSPMLSMLFRDSGRRW